MVHLIDRRPLLLLLLLGWAAHVLYVEDADGTLRGERLSIDRPGWGTSWAPLPRRRPMRKKRKRKRKRKRRRAPLYEDSYLVGECEGEGDVGTREKKAGRWIGKGMRKEVAQLGAGSEECVAVSDSAGAC